MRLKTGVEILDRRLGGGVPAGSLVSLVAQPDTQCELLLRELARCRETIYISTVVPEPELDDLLKTDTAAIEYVESDSLLENPNQYLEQIG